jgi:hypothetical protein
MSIYDDGWVMYSIRYFVLTKSEPLLVAPRCLTLGMVTASSMSLAELVGSDEENTICIHSSSLTKQATIRGPQRGSLADSQPYDVRQEKLFVSFMCLRHFHDSPSRIRRAVVQAQRNLRFK